MFWYAGKYLTYWDKPINHEAIVILSGNGGSEYINTGYQRRYLDIKKYLNEYEFKHIYLMGRKQELEEYSILSALIVSDGISKSKIRIVNKTFGEHKREYKIPGRNT